MLLKAVDVSMFSLEVMYPRGMLFFFYLLHALPSCVWADPLDACSPITHQPQKKTQQKTASSSFFCTCSALRCIASGKWNIQRLQRCARRRFYPTHSAGDQYGSILNGVSVSLRQLKFSSPEAAPQIDSLNLTWLESTAAETHSVNALIHCLLFVL